MKGFTICENKVLGPLGKEEFSRKGLPDFDAFRDFPHELAKYATFLINSKKISYRKSGDYDGYPFEDFFTFDFDVEKRFDESEVLSFRITFAASRGEGFDYQALAARSLSTAYKWRPSGKSELTNFSLYRVAVRHADSVSYDDICRRVDELRVTAKHLENSTSSLEAWANSDVGMAVLCSGSSCTRSTMFSPISEISHEVLKSLVADGVTIDELKKRLRCRQCGSPCKMLYPC